MTLSFLKWLCRVSLRRCHRSDLTSCCFPMESLAKSARLMFSGKAQTTVSEAGLDSLSGAQFHSQASTSTRRRPCRERKTETRRDLVAGLDCRTVSVVEAICTMTCTVTWAVLNLKRRAKQLGCQMVRVNRNLYQISYNKSVCYGRLAQESNIGLPRAMAQPERREERSGGGSGTRRRTTGISARVRTGAIHAASGFGIRPRSHRS